MICTKCKRKILKKELGWVNSDPYCKECYERKSYFESIKRRTEKVKEKKLINKKIHL